MTTTEKINLALQQLEENREKYLNKDNLTFEIMDLDRYEINADNIFNKLGRDLIFDYMKKTNNNPF